MSALLRRLVAGAAAKPSPAGVQVCFRSHSAQPRGGAAAEVAAYATCELTDKFMTSAVDDETTPREVVAVRGGLFNRDYGGRVRFAGRAATIKCFENNPLVREALTTESGVGRVLVVDGGASMRCALLGDVLAKAGADNGWAGVIVNGCVRDSAELARLPIGVKALGTHPLKSSKRDKGMVRALSATPAARPRPAADGGLTHPNARTAAGVLRLVRGRHRRRRRLHLRRRRRDARVEEGAPPLTDAGGPAHGDPGAERLSIAAVLRVVVRRHERSPVGLPGAPLVPLGGALSGSDGTPLVRGACPRRQ